MNIAPVLALASVLPIVVACGAAGTDQAPKTASATPSAATPPPTASAAPVLPPLPSTAPDDAAAEADFAKLDHDLCQRFFHADVVQGCPPHHVYTGLLDDVRKQYDADRHDADETWKPLLAALVEKYTSPKWTAAARARIGALYDSLRTGLDAYAPVYFDKQLQDLFAVLSQSSAPMTMLDFSACPVDKTKKRQYASGLDVVNAAQDGVRACWHTSRQALLDSATETMVTYYAQGAALAKRASAPSDPAIAAARRLAFYASRGDFGDAVMRRYVEKVPDPQLPSIMLTYTDGMYASYF
jgi:hypothetical protein